MKILVLGASKGTGALATKVALDHGHDVSAFARSPDNLVLSSPRLTRIKGDFHNRASVEAAVKGHDAVLVTASSTGGLAEFKRNPRYFSKGTELTIDAMKAQGVRRLVVLSALGTGDSLPLMPFLLRKLMVGWLLRLPYEDHERQEDLVRASGLDWVIARPSRLTDGPAGSRYVVKPAPETVPMSISRADTADFLVNAAEVDTCVGKAVQLGG
ncbi:MAG: NAD(P)-dependent oxidoreductase [Polyangiaceae bacterium]